MRGVFTADESESQGTDAMIESASTTEDILTEQAPVPGEGEVGDGKARSAADQAVAHNAVTIDVCGRKFELPSADQLAFLAGLGVLAALEIIEWPVTIALAVGHQLAHSHHGRALREFGDALEEA
jgi:hypothetical protein